MPTDWVQPPQEEVLWIIHVKDGRSFTQKDGTPDEVIKNNDLAEDDITSVERIVDGKVYTITKSRELHTFFVMSTGSLEMSMTRGSYTPQQIDERILGCYVDGKDGPIRLQLIVDAHTGNVKLVAAKVDKATKDGF